STEHVSSQNARKKRATCELIDDICAGRVLCSDLANHTPIFQTLCNHTISTTIDSASIKEENSTTTQRSSIIISMLQANSHVNQTTLDATLQELEPKHAFDVKSEPHAQTD